MKEKCEKINDIIDHASGNVYDIYYELYKECIYKQDNPDECLHDILVKVQKKHFDEDEYSELICQDKVLEMHEMYFGLLQGYVRMLVRQDKSVKEFYRELYEKIFESDLFPKDMESQAILLFFLGEKIIELPYHQVKDLIKMSKEDYKDTVLKLQPKIDEAVDMFNRHFQTRSEEASQIYRILSEIETREEKVVFLSVVFNLLKRNAHS